MKVLPLFILLFVFCSPGVYAQDNSWFKGSWQGQRSFPGSQVAETTPVTMEIDNVNGSVFGGYMQYRLPGSDTSIKLIRRISGTMYRRYIIITDWIDTYAADKKYNTLWSTCAGCPGSASFSINNDDLLLKITAGCSGECKGEMVFRRQLINYDEATQAALIRQFAAGTPATKAVATKARAVAAAPPAPTASADSIKQFPTLLHDGMGIDFDPSKYKTLSALTTDTGAIFNNVQPGTQPLAKTATATPAPTPVKPASPAVQKSKLPDSANIKSEPQPITKTNAPEKQPAPAAAPMLPSINTSNNNMPPPAADTVRTPPAAPPKDTVPAAIVERTTSLITSYEVTSAHITIQLFDDGQIDGDAVSVFYNGKLIVNNQTLTHKAITFNIDATAADRHHEFILISESEGFIAPNTALLRIRAGSQQFELTVSSNSATNAKIAIDYTGD